MGLLLPSLLQVLSLLRTLMWRTPQAQAFGTAADSMQESAKRRVTSISGHFTGLAFQSQGKPGGIEFDVHALQR